MNQKTSFLIEPAQPTIVIRRLFDAPPKLVFEAITKPEHIAKWWGVRGSTLAQCKVDLRPGGAWRFVLRMPDGSEHGFSGVYKEIAAPTRLVQTFIYDPFPDAEALETMRLDEQRGKTLLTVTVLHKSVEFRDGHVASGMESGASESHDRLAELLATMS